MRFALYLIPAALALAGCSNSDGQEILGTPKKAGQRWLTVAIAGSCAASEKSISVSVDRRAFALLEAGQRATTAVDTGMRIITAVSARKREWMARVVVYGDTTITLGCN